MSNNNYTRCRYTDPVGIECDVWFPVDEVEQFGHACVMHRGFVSPDNIEITPAKQAYIARVNEVVTLVAAMNFDEIDAHIAGLEKQIELLRTDVLATRAVRADKVNKLSDEERAERRKIKLVRAVEGDVASKPMKKITEASILATKYKIPLEAATTLKKLMDQFGNDEETAVKLLGIA